VKKIYKNAGIDEKKFTCHALRGSFSVLAMENGASIYEVSKVLRHKNINTTECYLRSLDRTKNKTEYIVGKVLEV
jgi:site-specific recombinase XerD